MSHKKGVYIDGHEREDVVKHRKHLLKTLHNLRNIHKPPPPCSDEPTREDDGDKELVVIYHDESICNTNEGAEKEGYWTSERFMGQMKNACDIAEVKYISDRYTLLWLFDQSSCHRKFGEHALLAKKHACERWRAMESARHHVWKATTDHGQQ